MTSTDKTVVMEVSLTGIIEVQTTVRLLVDLGEWARVQSLTPPEAREAAQASLLWGSLAEVDNCIKAGNELDWESVRPDAPTVTAVALRRAVLDATESDPEAFIILTEGSLERLDHYMAVPEFAPFVLVVQAVVTDGQCRPPPWELGLGAGSRRAEAVRRVVQTPVRQCLPQRADRRAAHQGCGDDRCRWHHE